MDAKAKNNKRPRKSATTTTNVEPDNGALPLRRSSRLAERSIKRARRDGDGGGEANKRRPALRGDARRDGARGARPPTGEAPPAVQLLEDAERDIIWPTNFSDTISLYQWRRRRRRHNGQMEEEQDDAGASSLIFRGSFHGEIRSVFQLSHCNGLVLVPTDTTFYVVNPATRSAQRRRSPRRKPPPRTSPDDRIATFFHGGLFFSTSHDKTAQRLCLRDETFSVIALPPCRSLLHETFRLSELNGVLCLAHAGDGDGDGDEGSSSSPPSVVIWMTEDGVKSRWSKLYVFRSMSMFIPIAPFHHGGSGGGVIGKRGDLLFCLVGDGEEGQAHRGCREFLGESTLLQSDPLLGVLFPYN
uniref:F-box associated domain-containing protein n=1 Tax=Oryza punctata TaxID=4537 RepID=A0A0E0KE33_ORYPU